MQVCAARPVIMLLSPDRDSLSVRAISDASSVSKPMNAHWKMTSAPARVRGRHLAFEQYCSNAQGSQLASLQSIIYLYILCW